MTNNADPRSAIDWIPILAEEFPQGKHFAVLVKTQPELEQVADALMNELGKPRWVRYIKHSARIEDMKSGGTIYIILGSDQYLLRGRPRDTKLVDPYSMANEDTQHRFK